jgi:hypothetical protein
MVTAEAKILSTIKEIEDRAGEFAALARTINQARATKPTDAAKSEELSTQLFTGFPGLLVLTLIDEENPLLKGDSITPDTTLIKSAVQRSYRQFHDHPPSSCFAPENMVFSGTKECAGRITELCGAFGSSETGQISVVTVGDDLRTANHLVNSPEEVRQYEPKGQDSTSGEDALYHAVQDATQAWFEDVFYFCAAAGSSGQRFEAKTISGRPDPPATNYAIVDSLESARKECIEIDALGAQANWHSLKAQFPDYFMLPIWESAINMRSKSCREAIQNWCANAYFVKGEVILGYITKGCEVREVTAEDVDNDITQFTALGVTRADRLKHSVLRDEIDLCKAARQRGFAWTYQVPSLKDCNAEGETKHK